MKLNGYKIVESAIMEADESQKKPSLVKGAALGGAVGLGAGLAAQHGGQLAGGVRGAVIGKAPKAPTPEVMTKARSLPEVMTKARSLSVPGRTGGILGKIDKGISKIAQSVIGKPIQYIKKPRGFGAKIAQRAAGVSKGKMAAIGAGVGLGAAALAKMHNNQKRQGA